MKMQGFMIEVFMLGVLVSLVKLTDSSTIIPGVALWSFGGLCCFPLLRHRLIPATCGPNWTGRLAIDKAAT